MSSGATGGPPITVSTDSGANQITIAEVNGMIDVFQNTPESGTPLQSVPADDAGPVAVEADGNDTFTVDYSGGDPIPYGLTIDDTAGGIAAPVLVVRGLAAGTGSMPDFTLSQGTVTTPSGATASGTSLVVSNAASSVADTVSLTGVNSFNLFPDTATGTLSVTGGAFVFNHDLDTGDTGSGINLSVGSGAAVSFGSTQHLRSLDIASGGAVDMLPAGGQLLDTNMLTDAGTLDLADNDLVVNTPSYGGESAAQIVSAVAAGVTASGTQGIIFSSTAATDGMTIGVAPNADLPTPLITLDGTPVPPAAVVARYTLAGDALLNGSVGSSDLGRVLANYGHDVAGSADEWTDGDFNYDGTVNSADSGVLLADFNQSLTNATPVPATAGTPFSPDFSRYLSNNGDSVPVRWDVNWGDGTNDSFPGSGDTEPLTAVHTYASAGDFLIQYSAVTLDQSTGLYGSYTAPAIPVAVSTVGVTATPLTLVASSSTDVMTVTANVSGDTVITDNGTAIETVPTDSILSLSVVGNPAYFSVDFSNGDPIPVAGFYTNAAQLQLSGPHGSDSAVTTGTAAIVGSDELRYSPSTRLVDNLDTTGGIVAVAGTTLAGLPFDGQSQPITVLPGATVIATGDVTTSQLTVNAGGTFRMAESGTALLDAGGLTLADPDTAGDNGGVIDLSDNDMIARQTPDSEIDQYLAAGFDSGLWDAQQGGGIDTDADPGAGPFPAAILSSAAAADPTSTHALGYEQVGYADDNWPAEEPFDDKSVAPFDTVIKYTVYGDANLDGTVDSTDQELTENGISSGLTGWGNGSFEYTGQATPPDGTLLGGIGLETLLDGVTTAPTSGPANPPPQIPNGTITGGTDVPNVSVSVNAQGVQGDITVSTGVSWTAGGKSGDNGISTTFTRTDGGTAVGTCRWIRLITVTGVATDGKTPLTGPYRTAGVSNWDKPGESIKLTRNYGETYDDAGSTLGYATMVRSAQGVVSGIDQPDQSANIQLRGGASSVTWKAQDFLVINNSIVYEVDWTFTQSIVGGAVTGTYSNVSSSQAGEIPGNPTELTLGIEQDGSPLVIPNAAHN